MEWTVALLSVKGGVADRIAGLDIQLVSRKNVAEKEKGEFRKYVLQNSNVLNPADQGIDLEGEVLDDAWVNHLLTKKVFSQGDPRERALFERSIGREALDVALDLSLLRYEMDREDGRLPSTQQPPKRPVGAVLRDMRQTSKGLLLLYPLDAKNAGLPSEPKSIITCAVSFPTSATAEPIEYQVNEVYQQLHLDQIEEPQTDE